MASRHMKRCSTSLLEKCKLKQQWGTTSQQSEWPWWKSLQIVNAEKSVEERECKLVQPLRKTVWRFHKTLKTRVAIWSWNPTPGHISRWYYNSKDMCIPMLIVALFAIARTCKWTSLVARMLKNLPVMQETGAWSLSLEDPLEKGMATHSSILAWRIHGRRSLMDYSPWSRKELDWAANTHTHVNNLNVYW